MPLAGRSAPGAMGAAGTAGVTTGQEGHGWKNADGATMNQQETILKIEGIGEIRANSILHTDAIVKAEQQLEFIEKHDIQVLFYADNNYPKR